MFTNLGADGKYLMPMTLRKVYNDAIGDVAHEDIIVHLRIGCYGLPHLAGYGVCRHQRGLNCMLVPGVNGQEGICQLVQLRDNILHLRQYYTYCPFVKTYVLKTEQKIPISLDEAWDFFSSPLNLAKITPPDMSFVVTSDYAADAKVYTGMIITYKIAPLLGIKMNWMTEITHVADKQYFVDEQRFGPYALWHHQHHFKEIRGRCTNE
jgi:ligand-binding SRPBCC domain-containing protein